MRRCSTSLIFNEKEKRYTKNQFKDFDFLFGKKRSTILNDIEFYSTQNMTDTLDRKVIRDKYLLLLDFYIIEDEENAYTVENNRESYEVSKEILNKNPELIYELLESKPMTTDDETTRFFKLLPKMDAKDKAQLLNILKQSNVKL